MGQPNTGPSLHPAPPTQLSSVTIHSNTVMLLGTYFLRQWMLDVSVRGIVSSQLQVPQKHQQPGSGAASRQHLFPAQHSHTTNQKFSAYPGLLPLHSCQLAPANNLIKHFLTMNEVTPSSRRAHTAAPAVDIQFIIIKNQKISKNA